jgi:Family of unknown function (DUF5694)
MLRHLAFRGLVLLTCNVIGIGAATQEPRSRSEPRAQIIVLGTYHFDNPGLDVVKTEVADVLTPAKQAEIKQVIEALARFRPTKIAVEVRADRAARLDSLYAAYRAGRHTLSRSEVQQLGFRLAERFGLPRLYPVDHEGEFPFGAVMQYAQEHDPAFVQRVQQFTAEMAAEKNRHQQQKSIGEILRLENDPARIEQGHAMYMEGASVGAGDTYVGADLLAKWYARNIRIFSDLQRIAQPGDRLLVIFGVGHAAILRELIANNPRLELIEANEYLPGPD